MSETPIDRSAYDAFAGACEHRHELCLTQIERLAEEGPARTEASKLLRVTIHDVVGEARFLRLTALSEVALELTQFIDGSQHRLGDTVFREDLVKWTGLLFEAAKLFATTVGDAGQSEIIDSLCSELRRARGAREGAPHKHSTDSNGRVLVLDDSEIVRYLLESHLEGRGFSTLTVDSYEQLETRIAAFEPDMVLVDINMPGIKGDEVCRRLRRRAETCALNIVLMSSLSDAELARLAAEAGADGFLSKQHGMEELAHYLDKLLAALPRPTKTAIEDEPQRAPKPRSQGKDTTLRSFHPPIQSDTSPVFSAAKGSLAEALEAAAASAEDEKDEKDEK